MKRIVFLGSIAFLGLIIAFWPLNRVFIAISLLVSFMTSIVGIATKLSREKTDERKKQFDEMLFWTGLIWSGIMAFIFLGRMFSEMAQVAD
jgi:disulfide bond formation protein DsbB